MSFLFYISSDQRSNRNERNWKSREDCNAKKRLKWRSEGSRAETIVRGGPLDPSKLVLELGPMEIHTFAINFEHNHPNN